VPTATGSALPACILSARPPPPLSPGGTDTRSNRGPHLRRRPVARREFTVTGYNGTIRRHHGRTKVAVHGTTRRVRTGHASVHVRTSVHSISSFLSLLRPLSLAFSLALAAAFLAPAGSAEPGARRSRPPSERAREQKEEGGGWLRDSNSSWRVSREQRDARSSAVLCLLPSRALPLGRPAAFLRARGTPLPRVRRSVNALSTW